MVNKINGCTAEISWKVRTNTDQDPVIYDSQMGILR